MTAIIHGDYPARCRIVVTDTQGADRLGLIWGFRSRHYDSAATAALSYEAEALTPLDAAAVATESGASGGASNNVVRHTNLSASWKPVLGTNLLAGTFLTHVGSYRVWARVRTPSITGPVKVRFVYDVGDLTAPAENAEWTIPGPGQFYLADLGEIRLDRVPVGPHRWQGQIQAQSANRGDDVQIDRLFFQPLDEAAGRVRAPVRPDDTLTTKLADDSFDQSAGALTGKSAPVGGTWTYLSGGATDFQVTGSGSATRATTSDGRLVSLGTSTYADVLARADVSVSAVAANAKAGVVLRWVDANNYVRVLIDGDTLAAEVAVGSSLVEQRFVTARIRAGVVYRVQARADATGTLFAWVTPYGSPPGDPFAVISHTALATGGVLASGRVGLYDSNGATAVTRTYHDFAAVTPVKDAVVMASQSAELRTDGMVREDSAGAAFGPQSHVIGDLPRVPPSGMEDRPVELFVLPTRGDLEQIPDSAVDDVNVRVHYRPSYLFVPSA